MIDVAERAVLEIVPVIHAGTVEAYDLPVLTDMSHSNFGHVMTLALHRNLLHRGMPNRREEHVSENGWHYVIAHTFADSAPTDDDLITDLTPWQHPGITGQTGLLHLRRGELEKQLRDASAPEWYVGLRGLATITQTHTLRMNPHRVQ